MTDRPFRSTLGPQGAACAGLGSPFMARLMALMAARDWPDTALTRRLFDWPGDTGGTGAAVALRLAGGLHRLVLSGAAPDLARVYPPHDAPDDALWAAVHAALTEHEAALDAALDLPPQTNEVRRSAALSAAGHWLARRIGLPMSLSEIGASAGLNLNWDRFGLDIGGQSFGPPDAVLRLDPDWRGALPPATPPRVVDRRGVDLNPLDASDPADRLRLLSFLWPDQTHRLDRTRAALTLPPARVDRGDMLPWLQGRLAKPQPGRLHLVFHTIVFSYLPDATRAAAEDALASAGAAATPEAPLARFAMEAGGPHAILTLQLWPDGGTMAMGLAGYHGEWLDWQPPEGSA
jgi:hypothetical protein